MFRQIQLHHFIIILTSLVWGVSCNSTSKSSLPAHPNVILIMGDDIGFSDLGCYGSEIPTPNLDRLASDGMRFRQFYNMSKCEPSRSVLLTGHYTGDNRSISIGRLMRDNGYYTVHSGKEHFLPWVPKSVYAANVFDQSYTFWAANEFFIPPDSTFEQPFTLNGKELHARDLYYKGKEFFKTDAFTDFAIDRIENRPDKSKPFFLYLPYGAAHYPLQAPKEDIDRFRGTYLTGWDSLRQKRFEKMIENGMLDSRYKLSEPSSNTNRFRGHPAGDEEIRAKIPLYRPWASLTDDEKIALDLEMSVYAAMVYRMDYNIGRVIRYLEDCSELENTLIMYLSDNGSCPYDSNRDFNHEPGDKAGFRTLSAAWANLGNTPFRNFKQFGHEGGAHTHFIAHWPKIISKNTISDFPGHLVDIYPTILDAAGVSYPDSINGESSVALHGTSLLPALQGINVNPDAAIVSGFQDRFRMFRSGDWKIVKANGEKWELYSVKEDLTETQNLADSLPEMVTKLEQEYRLWESKLPGGKAQF